MTHDEYLRHDATGLAKLVRTREVTPLELIDLAIRRLDEVDPAVNAVVYRMDGEARALAGGIDRNAMFAGVPFLAKDLQSDYAGHPHLTRQPPAGGPCAEARHGAGAAVAQNRGERSGQDQPARVRPAPLYGAGVVGPLPQPVGAGPHPGGIQRWIGCRCGCRYRADGGWRGRRRVDPHAGVLLRTLRTQADAWPHSHGTPPRRVVAGCVHRARTDTLRAGQRGHAGRDPRAGAGSVV